QFTPFARRVPADAGNADGNVTRGRLRIREQMESHALGKPDEGVAQGAPATVVGRPVHRPEVGANPNFGAAGVLILDVVVRSLEHEWQVGRSAGGAGRGNSQ